MPSQLENESRLRTAMVGYATAQARCAALMDAKSEVDRASWTLATLQSTAEQAKIQAAETRDAAMLGYETVLPALTVASSVDQLLRRERFAGKEASVDYIKANPECLEADAVAAWDAAGKAATGLPVLLQDTANLAIVYRTNLASMGLTPDATWEAQRAWIIATDKAVIMGA